ncbi:MAG: oligopeptide transport system substrate-binding protein [Glaciecola sp.]
MKTRLSRRFAVVVLVGGLILSACDGQGDFAVRPAVADASSGGTIAVGIDRPGAIDPGTVYEPAGQFIVRTMCDTLLQQDPLTGELVGGLAESWIITDLGNKFTIRLRDDLKFSNGVAVTADDVVRSLSRIASQDYASGVQDLLILIDGFDEISGRIEADRDEDLDSLRGLRVIDSRSFEIRLKAVQGTSIRFPDFLRAFTHPATSPINAAVVRDDPEAMAEAPICVGPYQLAEPWSGGDRITLVRSTAYTPANGAYTSGGTGYADQIIFKLYDTADERQDAFADGEVDVTVVDPMSVGAIRRRFDDDIQTGLSGSVEYIGLPAGADSAWNSPAIRVAFSMALDRRGIVSRAFGRTAEPATTFYPPTLGPEFYVEDACKSHTPLGPDVDGAREVLAQAGIDLSTKPTLTLHYNDEGGYPTMARIVAQSWRDAFGIDVELEPMPWDDYLEEATSNKGFDGAFRMSWRPDYPGPDQYVNGLFTEGGAGQSNWAHFADPELTLALSREVRRNDVDADIRVEYRRFESDGLCDRMPMIPVAYGTQSTAIDTSRIGPANGRYLDAGTGLPLVRELFVRAP